MATKYMDPLSIAVGAGARERQAWAENRVMETSVLSGVHVYTVVDAPGFCKQHSFSLPMRS